MTASLDRVVASTICPAFSVVHLRGPRHRVVGCCPNDDSESGSTSGDSSRSRAMTSWLASRYAANNERLQLKAMAVAYSSFGVISVFIYLSPNRYIAFGLMGLAMLGVFAVADLIS